jgi:hypothetical protein
MTRTQHPIRRAVRIWLAEHDRSQSWLAQKLGISQGHLSQILDGFRVATPQTIKDLRRVTGIDITPPAQSEVA